MFRAQKKLIEIGFQGEPKTFIDRTMKVKESQRKFSCGPVTCYKVNLSLTINYYSEST